MVSSLTLVHKYISVFRAAINSKVWSGKKTIKELLRLNEASDWDFLCAAMDIVDDASAAINHVQRYGLSGATKFDDLGERYLRLYGLLSATYIQQQSVLKIYQIMNVPHLKRLKDRLDTLEIRSLRHKLSSHSTDYVDRKTGKMESFVPIQFDLQDTNISYVNHTSSSERKRVNLTEAIEAHSKLLVEVLDEILVKAIKTIFQGQEKKQKEFSEKLSDLRIEKEGGFIIGGAGPKIIVTVVAPKEK